MAGCRRRAWRWRAPTTSPTPSTRPSRTWPGSPPLSRPSSTRRASPGVTRSRPAGRLSTRSDRYLRRHVRRRGLASPSARWTRPSSRRVRRQKGSSSCPSLPASPTPWTRVLLRSCTAVIPDGYEWGPLPDQWTQVDATHGDVLAHANDSPVTFWRTPAQHAHPAVPPRVRHAGPRVRPPRTWSRRFV